MVTLSPLLVGLVWATDSNVSFGDPGARLRILLPELSKAIGRRLEVSRDLEDVVLAVRLDAAPTADVLSRVAYAAGAKWESSGDALVLTRDLNGEEKSTQDAAADRTRTVTDLLRSLGARLGRTAQAASAGVSGNRPAIVAMAKLAAGLDAAQIGSLRIGDVCVFSTVPRPLQHKLPADAQAIFANMVHEMRAASPAKGKPAPRVRAPFSTDVAIRLATTTVSGFPTVYTGGVPGLDIRVNVFDRAGVAVASQEIFVTRPHPAPPTNADDRTPVSISPFTKRLLDVWPGPWLPKPDIENRLRHPLTYDPTDWFGSVLVDYAAATHRQLVAAIPDQALSDIGGMSPEDLTNGFVESEVRSFGGSVGERWILLNRPIDGDANAWTTVNRASLEAMAAAGPKAHPDDFWSTIDSIRAGYNGNVRLPQWSWLGFDEDAWQSALGELALLSDAQLSTILKGGKVPLAATPPAFRAIFAGLATRGPAVIYPALLPHPTGGIHGFQPTYDRRGLYTEVANSLQPSTAYVFIAAAGAYGNYVAAPGVGAAETERYPSPLPPHSGQPLKVAFCIKPGYNLLGDGFRFIGSVDRTPPNSGQAKEK